MENGDLALRIFDEGGVKLANVKGGERGFRLKKHDTWDNAPESPIYVSLRGPNKGSLSPETLALIGEEIACLSIEDAQRGVISSGTEASCVIGLPNAGTPLAASFAEYYHLFGLPMKLLTMDKHEEAGKREILPGVSGDFQEGEIVDFLDDLITGSETKEEGIKGARAVGLRVYRCYVYLDRQQGGEAKLAAMDVKLRAVTTLNELVGFYLSEGRIDRAMYEQVLAYPAELAAYIESQTA